ncbi:MAG TPA: DOMON-like domain-containing protein [Caulobacteraceae bacterium]
MYPLVRHPSTPAPSVASVEVDAARVGGELRLRFVLTGALERLALPEPVAPERTDELWRHTCFEAFVQAAVSDEYLELNLAPSTAWAAYVFEGHRAGMRPARLSAPRIEVWRRDERLELQASLDLGGSRLDGLDWRLGLTAVIEDTDGALSYWALRHPPGKPDFHNADCFALELPGSRGP